MDKLTVELEHCYGIAKLTTDFDFARHGRVFAVYAPNGVMKTSFANTFRDLSRGEPSSDRVWPNRTTRRLVVDEGGRELSKESIFVVEPYNQGFRSERISTLLINDALRREYEAIHRDIDAKADVLVGELKPMVGQKAGIREALSDAITHGADAFLPALVRVEAEVREGIDSPLGDVIYADVFNPKTEILLSDPDFRSKVLDYIEKYEELIGKSTFFRKGVFTHNNAAEVAKNLDTNGFFKAQHSLYLRIGGEKREIATLKELENAIQEEKNRILEDKQLRTAFDAMDKLLTKNAEHRRFRACLEQHPVLLPELANPERLKQRLWVAYLIRARQGFADLVDAHSKGKTRIAEILERARSERTRWADVISIFNERFSVPFVVRMVNQEDVILRSAAPSICFDFLEDADDKDSPSTPVEEGALMQTLSSGEKRALYILNIIYEVVARKTEQQPTLFVVDDIADSFDYKNKYAIIEYLNEIRAVPWFRQIILSHNFDFFRTVSSRLGLARECRRMACKAEGMVWLQEEQYQKCPFTHWRKNLTNRTMLIASIPFLRNLAEFTGDNESRGKLTSLLHLRPDSRSITYADLEALVKLILDDQDGLSLSDPTASPLDAIRQVAMEIASDDSEDSALEKKVAISVAIRLKAEEIMVRRIDDEAFWRSIDTNQTIQLISRYKDKFPSDRDGIQLFEQVNLMTPENIHLNSFMYEPILDLSAHHLKKLYRRLCDLN